MQYNKLHGPYHNVLFYISSGKTSSNSKGPEYVPLLFPAILDFLTRAHHSLGNAYFLESPFPYVVSSVVIGTAFTHARPALSTVPTKPLLCNQQVTVENFLRAESSQRTEQPARIN